MMQAFEEDMRTLRRAIGHWLGRLGWPRNAQTAASEKLARELGLPTDLVSAILERAAADIRKLSDSGADDVEVGPIIDRAVHDLSKLGFHSRPFEEAIMDRYLQQLPERDYQILSYFKQGRKHSEIAELLGMDVASVRDSLVKTYADLRIRMLTSSDPDGGGMPTQTQPAAGSFDEPMKRTSLRHH